MIIIIKFIIIILNFANLWTTKPVYISVLRQRDANEIQNEVDQCS